MTESVSQKLLDIIDQEHTALLEGDLDGLNGLVEEKEDLIERLDGGEKIEHIEKIHVRMRRNHELFDQALKGIQNVANRISELRRAQDGLETYDAEGRFTSIKRVASKKVERRA